jgi:hypothetical protein
LGATKFLEKRTSDHWADQHSYLNLNEAIVKIGMKVDWGKAQQSEAAEVIVEPSFSFSGHGLLIPGFRELCCAFQCSSSPVEIVTLCCNVRYNVEIKDDDITSLAPGSSP